MKSLQRRGPCGRAFSQFMMTEKLYHPLIWFGIFLICLLFCTYLPLRIKNPELRKKISWFVLIPVSLILIFYAYPAGIEIFRRLALVWR